MRKMLVLVLTILLTGLMAATAMAYVPDAVRQKANRDEARWCANWNANPRNARCLRPGRTPCWTQADPHKFRCEEHLRLAGGECARRRTIRDDPVRIVRRDPEVCIF
jgi:hypothetical protein